MSSFSQLIKTLSFPKAPFCQDVAYYKASLVSSLDVSSDVFPLFAHLKADLYEFHKTQDRFSRLAKVGVLFSGGQASGGHNVIWGLQEALTTINPHASLIGFLGGPQGLLDNRFKIIDSLMLESYRNTGGFDLIGSGRTKIETNEQLKQALETIKSHKLEALVIIGGDDSNTNAALLANYLKDNQSSCTVVGVPKTIDGDLKNEFVEVSFGFDTASKLFSELVGNLQRDALSAKKYYHFVKIMGRSASHLALEVALSTQPNLALISEEIAAHHKKLIDVVEDICQLVKNRAKNLKHYGVIVIPEGLIEAMVDVQDLLKQLTQALLEHGKEKAINFLSQEAKDLFLKFPESVQKQLLFDTDPHGNVQVSLIETEKLLSEMVKKQLTDQGLGDKFAPLCHFFGYEGRCGYPSYFDAIYSYHLGVAAALFAKENLSGYMVALSCLEKAPEAWKLCALPIVSLMNLETRKEKLKPVIKKALVSLEGIRFKQFQMQRHSWTKEDAYLFPGPMQYFGSFKDLYNPCLLICDKH